MIIPKNQVQFSTTTPMTTARMATITASIADQTFMLSSVQKVLFLVQGGLMRPFEEPQDPVSLRLEFIEADAVHLLPAPGW